MANVTLKLIKEYPFVFKDCEEFPAFNSPHEYLYYFEQRNHKKFIMFSFPDPFRLEILHKLKDKVYNSFHCASNQETQSISLITYFQFDRYNHAACCYVLNQKTNEEGLLMNFYVTNHDFVTNFIKENEEHIMKEIESVGFRAGFA